MLKDTTSRGLRVRVRPPHTIERRGGGILANLLAHNLPLPHKGEGLRARRLARRRGAREEEWTGGATTPHPSMLRLIRIARLGSSQTDFALQAIVECRAAKAK